MDEIDLLANLNLDQATKIFESSTSEIFKVQNLNFKIFKPTAALILADLEIEKTKLVGRTDLPIPRILQDGFVQGRRVIIRPWVEGSNVRERLSHQPLSLFWLAKNMARLHRRIHSQIVAELPKFTDRLIYRLKQDMLNCTHVSSAQRHALEIVESMPDANYLCHGDFFFGNIIVSPKGWHAIDWTWASRGDPFAEMVQTWLSIRLNALPKGLRGLLHSFGLILFAQIYKMEYLKYSNNRSTYARWAFVVSVSMYSEDLNPKSKKFLAQLIRVLSRQPSVRAVATNM